MLTVTPPAGVGPSRVIVAVEFCPPLTVEGSSESPITFGGLIVRSFDLVEEPSVAVIVTVVAADTAVVPTVNVPLHAFTMLTGFGVIVIPAVLGANDIFTACVLVGGPEGQSK